MEKFNISKPEKYIKDGVEKTFWHNIGTLKVFKKQDGTKSTIIEIPAIGLKANVFPATQKTTSPQTTAPAKKEVHVNSDNIEYPEEDINPEDIPF